MTKLLAKLQGWTWEDLGAVATATYGTTDLTKRQVVDLVRVLKAKDLTKPERQFYDQLPTRSIALSEVSWKDNGEFEAVSETQWVLADGRLALAFDSPESVATFALSLLELDASSYWCKSYRGWRSRARLPGFNPPALATGYNFSPGAHKALERARTRDWAQTLPLPDNTGLRRRYWSLQPGDAIVHVDGHRRVVTAVRINAGSAPTVTFGEAQ